MILNSPYISGSLTVTGNIITSGSITISGSIASASYASNADLLDGLDSTVFTLTSSFNTTSASLYATSGSLSAASGSFNSRVTTIESKYATTGSNNFRAPQYVSDTTVPTGFANSSASIYTDGGLLVAKDSYFSSSMFIKGNLTIYGTQSIAYITSSQLNIATNVITVNTATPSVRFGGLSVYDSGSTGTGMTGSLLWDSQNNSWIYNNPSGSGNYDSAMVIMGPRNASALGGEVGLTCNYLVQGHGHHHTTSSAIFHDGSTTCLPGAIVGGSTATFSSCIIAGGDTIVCNNNIKTFSNTYGSTGLIRMYGIDSCEKYQQGLTTGGDFYQYTFSGLNHIFYTNGANERMRITSGGNIGIGHSAPEHKLHVCINCAATDVTIAQFENKDYTAGTRSYARVRAWLNAGSSYSSYFGQSQDGKTYIYANNTSRCGDIVIDANTGYVGLGTNSPGLQLHINSTTSDYNTMFSTACVCGRAGWVIARPGSSSAIASGLVLASDCSYRLGTSSYYQIKMLQDGSTSILNTSEGDAFKVLPGGITLVNSSSTLNSSTHQFQVNGRAHFSSYYAGIELYSTAWGAATYFQNAVNVDVNDTGDYLSINNPASKGFVFRQGSSQAVTITTAGNVYLGPGYGATNHRIDKAVTQGNNVLVVSGYNGSSNDTAIFYGVSGAGGNAAATAIWVATNTATGRSINAGGTINASGGDYAEYMLKRCDTGCIAKGQIVGIDACRLLTDKWSLAHSFVIKSTDPSYVGGDNWSSHLGNKPQRTEDVSEEEFAPIIAEFEAKLEEARNKVDRIAFSGQVPVIVSGSYNLGDYILPIEGPDDTIVGVACSISSLNLVDYSKTVGRVWGTCLDKAWIAVKIG